MNSNSLESWRAWAKAFPQKADAAAPYVSPFRVVNKGSATAPAEILIYDQIGRDFWTGDGMAATDFANLLKGIDPAAELVIGINSPGGNVWDGLAIYNQLLAHPGKVTTRNDGMAASIASVILQAGQHRTGNMASLVMIHRAWGMMVGNAADAERFKNDLQKHDQVIAGIYALKSGKPLAEIEAAMAAETTYTGTEALNVGLLDSVIAADTKKNFSPAPAGLSHSAPSIAATHPAAGAFNLTGSSVKPGIPTGAAGNHTQPQGKIVMQEPNPSAPAATVPPVPDFSPLLAAINSLNDNIKNLTIGTGNSLPGTAPINLVPAQVINRGNPMIEKFQAMEAGEERGRFVRNNWNELGKRLVDAGIYNANTIDSSLANSVLSSDAVTTMRTYLAPLDAFTHKTEMVAATPRQVINVPLVSSAGSMQTNPTSFETGDTTQALIAVTVGQYSKSFFVSIAEKNLGISLAAMGPTNAKVLAEGVWGLLTAKITTGNYGSATTIGAAANFDTADLPAILALGKNYGKCGLLLDGGHLAYLLPTDRLKFVFGEPGAYGFDGGIWKNNLWTGATTNCVGFVYGPDALVYASALPAQLPSGEFVTSENVTIGNGLQVTASTWFSRSTRAMWASYDVMFGCAVGDGTQAEVLISA